jgi:hypothetical protein
MKLEGALGLLLAKPCISHYNFDGPVYRPYMKNQSHRSVVQAVFLDDKILEAMCEYFEKKMGGNSNQPNKDRFKHVLVALLAARSRNMLISATRNKANRHVHTYKMVQGIIEKVAYGGALMQHGPITVEK